MTRSFELAKEGNFMIRSKSSTLAIKEMAYSHTTEHAKVFLHRVCPTELYNNYYSYHHAITVIFAHHCRSVSKFLSSRFHPKSRRLYLFHFSNITLRTDLLAFGVTRAVFKIAGEMRRLPAYFDNPVEGYASLGLTVKDKYKTVLISLP